MATNSLVIARNDPVSHWSTLGLLWIVYGVIRLAEAFLLVSHSGTATVMFGALLNRAPNPRLLMSMFHLLYAAAIVLSVVCGLIGALGGLALIAGRRTGRALTITAGFLSLCNLPLGTTLGIYTLIMLLPPSMEEVLAIYPR